VHADKCGLCPHFWGFSPNGGFGVWWFFPPNPALAGNASRWASRIIFNHFFKQWRKYEQDIPHNHCSYLTNYCVHTHNTR